MSPPTNGIRGLPIEDLQREQQVIAQLGERATALGIEDLVPRLSFGAD